MGIPVCNTRAEIEDYSKGKIAEIIFDSYGTSKDKEFIIVHPERLAYEIGRELCDCNEELSITDITKEARYAVEDIEEEIVKFLYEYITNNFEGEFND